MHRSVAIAVVLPALLALSACETSGGKDEGGSPEASESGNDDSRSESNASQDGGSETDDATLRETVRNALCEERDPCKLERQWKAGEDEEGRSLIVQKLRLSEREEPPDEIVKDPYHVQWWLARMSDGTVESRQLLVDDNQRRPDLYDKDEVEVDQGRLIHSHRHRSGAANYYTLTAVVELAPLRIVESRRKVERKVQRVRKNMKWVELRGRSRWFTPVCNEKGEPDGGVNMNFDEWYSYKFMPKVELDASFRNGGWEDTSLGSCAAEVTSAGTEDFESIGQGFVVHGDRGDGDDARFRAVFGSATELFIEIVDDHWIRDADSKILNDHLEIWFANDDPDGGGPKCLVRETSPRHLGVGLDGSVYSATGTPVGGALEAKIQGVDADSSSREHSRFRAKLTFADKPEFVTVVYSDSDDGDEQERLIATSKLESGDLWSLGRTIEIEDDIGRCEVEEERLEFKPDQSFEPETAAVNSASF